MVSLPSETSFSLSGFFGYCFIAFSVILSTTTMAAPTHEMERLTIEVEDSDVVVQGTEGEEKEDDLTLCLIGRFLTDRRIRLQVMKDRMAGIWCPFGGIMIRELEVGNICFNFIIRWMCIVCLKVDLGLLTNTSSS